MYGDAIWRKTPKAKPITILQLAFRLAVVEMDCSLPSASEAMQMMEMQPSAHKHTVIFRSRLEAAALEQRSARTPETSASVDQPITDEQDPKVIHDPKKRMGGMVQEEVKTTR